MIFDRSVKGTVLLTIKNVKRKQKRKSDIARTLNDNDIVVVESDFFRV